MGTLEVGRQEVFERIYDTDLVFQPGCWQLCGDAHCCSFSRHKARFLVLGRKPGQELPLLPGEFEFLEAKGWLQQFQDYERTVLPFDFGPATIRLDAITSRRPQCACDHATRTTVCRLYPLLPVFDEKGTLVGTEPLGIYEELERLDGLEPACRLTTLPFDQLELFLGVSRLLASDPVLLFHLMAYRLVKGHIAARLREARSRSPRSAFRLFELADAKGTLIDSAELKDRLGELYGRFELRHGQRFSESNAFRSGSS